MLPYFPFFLLYLRGMKILVSLFPEAGQTYVFDWISLIFLLVVILAMLNGIRKGFIRSALSFFAVAIAFFAAYLLAKPLANWIYGINGCGESLHSSMTSYFITLGNKHPVSTGNSVADAIIYVQFGSKNAMEWVVSKSQLQATVYGTEKTVLDFALESVSLPSFLMGYVKNFILSAVPETASENMAYYLGQSASMLLIISICFACLFLVVFVITKILAIVLGLAFSHLPMVKWLDKLLGAAFGIVIGLIEVSYISAGLVAFSAIPEFYSFLDGVLKLSDPNAYTVGKVFYNNNFLECFLGYFSSWIPQVGVSVSSASIS